MIDFIVIYEPFSRTNSNDWQIDDDGGNPTAMKLRAYVSDIWMKFEIEQDEYIHGYNKVTFRSILFFPLSFLPPLSLSLSSFVSQKNYALREWFIHPISCS